MPQLAAEQPRQIIGIVGDVRGNGLDSDPGPAMYIVQAQVPDAINALNAALTPMRWIVRTRGNPLRVAPAVQEQIRQTTGLPVTDVRTMDEIVSRSTSRQRFNMLLMTIFGSAALFLAGIGIYGLMAYSVQQRTQEIGIRLALGRGPGSVRKMVVMQGMRLALVGVAVGIAAALRADPPALHLPLRREGQGPGRLHHRGRPADAWCRCWPSGCPRAAPRASTR